MTLETPQLGQTGWARFAPIPLRLIVGYGFWAHGLAKLMKGPDRFVDIVLAIGFPAPFFSAWFVILVELLGGIAILLGLFVPWVSIAMIPILLVAIFTVHLPNGFSSIKLMSVTEQGAQFGQPGYETDLLYLACIFALLLLGSGPFSMQNLFRRSPATTYNSPADQGRQ